MLHYVFSLDADYVLDEKEIVYEGMMLQFSAYIEDTNADVAQVNHRVQVAGVPPESEYSNSKLKLFFTNKTRGGPIENITRDDKHGTAVLTFENHTGTIYIILMMIMLP